MDPKGASALVTGGHQRIGRAISVALASRGCNVAIQYNRSEEAARATVEELQGMRVRAVAIKAELASPKEIEAMVGRADDALGPIDILVNNASAFWRTPFDQITEADWDTFLAVNLKAPFLICWHLGRRMRDRGRGKIINIADWAAERPYKHYLPYCVSKGGVITLTRALAKELAPAVEVNAICPGPILWPSDTSEEDKTAVLTKTPLGRVGAPRDIANTVLFLVEGTDFTTGAAVVVDGGRTIF